MSNHISLEVEVIVIQ